jgi:hypothetical protein
MGKIISKNCFMLRQTDNFRRVSCSTNYTIRDRQLRWFKYIDRVAINDMIQVGASTSKRARIKYFVREKKMNIMESYNLREICMP